MDAFIATILPTGFNYNPYGWQLCWGQQLNVNQYQAAFALMSTYYGGDGVSTFNLPDLRGRVPIGFGAKDGGPVNYTIGAKYGSDAHAITLSELPTHSHSAVFTPTKGSVITQTTAVAGNQTVSAKVQLAAVQATTNLATEDTHLANGGSGTTRIYSPASPALTDLVSLGGVSATLAGSPSIPSMNITVPDVVTGGTVAIGTTGIGVAIDIRPSSQTINFIICMNGLYPTRE